MSAQVEVEVITEVNGELVAAFARLVPQLSRSAPPPDRDTLAAMVRHDAITLLVARLDGEVVGTLTLVMFPIGRWAFDRAERRMRVRGTLGQY